MSELDPKAEEALNQIQGALDTLRLHYDARLLLQSLLGNVSVIAEMLIRANAMTANHVAKLYAYSLEVAMDPRTDLDPVNVRKGPVESPPKSDLN